MPVSQRPFLIAAVLLTIALFLIGGHPSASTFFPEQWHWIAHFITYTLIAALYSFGLARYHLIVPAVVVILLGGLHEYYEITSHGHPFEVSDFAVNSLGAFAGAVWGRTAYILLTRPTTKTKA